MKPRPFTYRRTLPKMRLPSEIFPSYVYRQEVKIHNPSMSRSFTNVSQQPPRPIKHRHCSDALIYSFRKNQFNCSLSSGPTLPSRCLKIIDSCLVPVFLLHAESKTRVCHRAKVWTSLADEFTLLSLLWHPLARREE